MKSIVVSRKDAPLPPIEEIRWGRVSHERSMHDFIAGVPPAKHELSVKKQSSGNFTFSVRGHIGDASQAILVPGSVVAEIVELLHEMLAGR